MSLFSDEYRTYYRVHGRNTTTGQDTTITMFFDDGSNGPLTDTIYDELLQAVRGTFAAVEGIWIDAYRVDPVRADL